MNIQEKTGVTFIVVTHDQEEAMTLSTRIAVMNNGLIQQVGTPSEVYEFPKTRYIADFLGSVNLFEGTVTESPDTEHVTVRSDEAGIELHIDSFEKQSVGSAVAVAIRPEKIAISKDRPGQQENVCRGRVDEIAYQGSLSIYQVELAGGKMVRVTTPNLTRTAERPIDWEEEVWLCWDRHAGVILAD